MFDPDQSWHLVRPDLDPNFLHSDGRDHTFCGIWFVFDPQKIGWTQMFGLSLIQSVWHSKELFEKDDKKR